MSKPTITRGPASQYQGTGEIIREFSDGRSGGLISIRRNDVTDKLVVDIYRTDDDVEVRSAAGPVQNMADAIREAIALGLEGESIAGIDLLLERFPELGQ